MSGTSSYDFGGDLPFTAWPDSDAKRFRELGYWRGLTLDRLLGDAALRHGERIALSCGSRSWSYAELDEHATRLAAGFKRMGIRPKDRVVVQLPNIAAFFTTLFALFRMGALPVLSLPAHRQSEIKHFFALTKATAYVTCDRFDGYDYRELARQLVANPALNVRHVAIAGAPEEFIALDSLLDAPIKHQRVEPNEVAFLQLSGGSTALPKLIPRTHDDYFYSVRESAKLCGLSSNSVYLCALPAAHNFPLSSPGTLGTFFAGGRVVLAQSPAPDEVFRLIERERVTISAVVPPLALLWMDAASRTQHDLSSLVVLQVGGAKFAPQAAQRVSSTLKCQLQQVFGMAEGLVNYTRLDDRAELVFSTQGRPISPDDEVRIVDDDDEEVAPGTVGHLLTRGPYTIRGYFMAGAHNASAFTHDGFYRTGDLVRRLPTGHIIVEGRAKDQINRGGDKIAGEELEEHLLAHPDVHDAAVVAFPDAFLGEKTCAFLVAQTAPVPDSELSAFIRGRGLAAYKVPDRFRWVERLPKTGVGKVDKRILRDLLKHNKTKGLQ